MNLIKLRIKAKSLAAEARIIRQEERRIKKIPVHKRGSRDIGALRNHRVIVVREAARCTHLAIAYLKGKDYKTVENHCKNEVYRDDYVFPKIAKMVKKYGHQDLTQEDWKQWVKPRMSMLPRFAKSA